MTKPYFVLPMTLGIVLGLMVGLTWHRLCFHEEPKPLLQIMGTPVSATVSNEGSSDPTLMIMVLTRDGYRHAVFVPVSRIIREEERP